MKKTVFMVAASVAWMTVIADGNRVVYENDFATRTSAGAVPYGGWRAVNYVAGQLLANTNWALATMFDYDDLQDNWIKASNTCRNNAYVDDDNGNYVARLGDDLNKDTSGSRTTGPYVIVRQRIGNTFTNGTVTLTFDMRPPSAWYFHSSDADYLRHCRFYLGSDAMYWNTPSAANTVCRMGVTYRGSLNGRRVLYRDDSAEDVVVSNAVVTSGNWLRYVANVDLDSRKWSFSCYDLGASHPTLDTATPATALYSSEELEFFGSSVSSISAIALDGYAILAGNSAARYDNIRIAHNGTECYVNDFITRRSRNFEVSSTMAAYSAERTLLNRFQYENTNNVLDVNGTVSTTAIGYDGWKRRNSGGKAPLIINGTSHYLYFSLENLSGKQYSRAAHPLGLNATNGTLKFRGDIRTPTKWWSGNRFIYLSLGDDTFYEDGSNDFGDHEFTRVGISSNGSGTNPGTLTNVYYWAGSATTAEANTSIDSTTFYRVVITAHLDGENKTYDYEMYRQSGNSDTSANGTLISSGSGLSSRTGVTSISCFGISAYGATDARFDNFRAWYTPSGSSEEYLVYQSSLDTRSIYGLEESMIGTLESEPTGMDGWTRLGASEKNVLLSSDGNAALVFGNGDGTYATAVHDLGGEYRGGEMTAQADICAPTAWQSAGGCANIWFGGDQYHEGNLNGGEYNYEKMAAFGFGITNTTFAAFRGDCSGGGAWETSGATTAGHWYRFLVFSQNRTSTVLVYDMGTKQPTLATATPKTPVATFSGLPFRRNVAVSCVGVSAMGVKNPTAWSHLLPGGTDVRLKVDNIKFSHIPSGTVIYFR